MSAQLVGITSSQLDHSLLLPVVRTPEKLVNMLIEKGVSKQQIDSNLQIIKGDIFDVEAVKRTIFYNGKPVSKIISGIGGYPKTTKSPEATLCRKAAASIVQALTELNLAQKPFLMVISTTGISNGPRDVPVLLVPLYHFFLAVPHEDKRVMDQIFSDAMAEGKLIGGFCRVRPSLLFDGKSKGMANIKVGDEENPAVGYNINKSDVGLWIFMEIIKGDASRWNGKMPSITY